MSYQAKDSAVRGRQLKVQRLSIPLLITGHATPASVVAKADEPAIMFVQTEGVDGITVAKGALDSGQAVPSFTAADDSDGKFGVLIRVGEQVGKIVSFSVSPRATGSTASVTLANTTGLDSVGDKICLDVDTAVDLSAANLDCTLTVEYVVAE